MAQWDTYRLSLVGTYDNVNIVNSFYYQEVVTGNVGTGPLDALWTAFNPVTTAYVGAIVSAYQGVCGTVRRLSPGITESRSYAWTAAGAIPADGLPVTNYALLRYSAVPHNSRKRNHIKYPGVAELSHQGGQLNNDGVTLYNAFVTEFLKALTADGYTFNPITSRKPEDPITQPLPRVSRAAVDAIVHNTRGRTVYVCTG